MLVVVKMCLDLPAFSGLLALGQVYMYGSSMYHLPEGLRSVPSDDLVLAMSNCSKSHLTLLAL